MSAMGKVADRSSTLPKSKLRMQAGRERMIAALGLIAAGTCVLGAFLQDVVFNAPPFETRILLSYRWPGYPYGRLCDTSESSIPPQAQSGATASSLADCHCLPPLRSAEAFESTSMKQHRGSIESQGSADWAVGNPQNGTHLPGRSSRALAYGAPGAFLTVLIAGTAKGGTSDLFQFLTTTLRYRAGIRKEMYRLGGVKLPLDITDRTTSEHISTYLRELQHPCALHIRPGSYAALDSLLDCVGGLSASPLTVDATPEELTHLPVPRVLRELSPDTKVVVLLRKPVERSQSLYNQWKLADNMFAGRSMEYLARKFLAWAELGLPAQLLHRLSVSNNIGQMAVLYEELLGAGLLTSFEFRLFGEGLYAYPLARWLIEYFEAGNVAVFDSQMYFADRLSVLTPLVRFLANRTLTAEEEMEAIEQRPVNAKLRNGQLARGAALTNATHEKLVNFFAPHTQQLLRVLACMRNRSMLVLGFEEEAWLREEPLFPRRSMT